MTTSPDDPCATLAELVRAAKTVVGSESDTFFVFLSIHLCVCRRAKDLENTQRLAKDFSGRMADVAHRYKAVVLSRDKDGRVPYWFKNPLKKRWVFAFAAYHWGISPEVTLYLMARAHILDDLKAAICEVEMSDRAAYDSLDTPVIECFDNSSETYLGRIDFISAVVPGVGGTIRSEIGRLRRVAWERAQLCLSRRKRHTGP